MNKDLTILVHSILVQCSALMVGNCEFLLSRFWYF